MTNLQENSELKNFLTLNRWANSYAYNLKQAEGDYNPYLQPKEIDINIQPESLINNALKDLQIIKSREQEYNKIKGLRIGDFIHLPDNTYTQITHIWNQDGQVQTGNNGSMHLGSGYISRSGSLDSGLNAKDLILTEETKQGTIWIFHKGFSGANRGVNYKINFRVYKTKPGADLSGIPQIEALKKQKIIEQSETITRINGNGQEYTMHMPEIIIIRGAADRKLKRGETINISSLKFVSDSYHLKAQPMKLKQINNLLKHNNFKGEFYNNASNKNKLYLEPTTAEDNRKYKEFK